MLIHPKQIKVTVPRWAIEKILADGDHCDRGPKGEGWSSDEMQKALDAIYAALKEEQ